MKINKLIFFISIFFYARGGNFKLPLDTVDNNTNKNFTNRSERLDRLLFDSASEKDTRKQFIEPLLSLRIPQESSNFSSYVTHVTSLKAVFNFLQKGDHKNAEIIILNFQEKLLSIVLRRAQDNEKYRAQGKNIMKSLIAIKSYWIGKNLQEKAQSLIADFKKEEVPFVKHLLYNKARAFYKEAVFFYNKSHELSFEKSDKDLIFKNEKACEKALRKAQKKIKKTSIYEEYKKKRADIKAVIEKNKSRYNKMLKQKEGLKEFEKAGPLSKKDSIEATIQRFINAENLKMGRAHKVSRDQYKQNIAALSTLLEKKDYESLAPKAFQFELNERRAALMKQLINLEKKYVDLASSYLELFKLFPRIEHVQHAEAVMQVIKAIGDYKIECNPHVITISDKIKGLWEEIEADKKIMKNFKLFYEKQRLAKEMQVSG
jgi:AcrR family transcriptional regulator